METTRAHSLDYHPLADLFPLVHGDEFDALVRDIEAMGLLVPIVMLGGRILDGRNRYRACTKAGVEPKFVAYEGTESDAVAYVLSLNLARRHLTTPQKAAIALDLLPHEQNLARTRMLGGGTPPQDVAGGLTGEATDLAGLRVGVSRETVRQAARIAEQAPDVVSAMRDGVVSSMPEARRLAAIGKERRGRVILRMRADGLKVTDALAAIQAEAPPVVPPTPTEARHPRYRLIYGVHALDALRDLPDASVHMVATSPPYWGLRDYGTGDQQIGMEPTPELYVETLVEVFGEVERVLKPDGTLWLNLGDTYWGGGGTSAHNQDPRNYADRVTLGGMPTAGQCDRPVKPKTHAWLRPKDLIGIPWRVALALQAKGWYLRNDIIWTKGKPMPESVKDRCTRSHEYLFMLAHPQCRGHYYYDGDAIREKAKGEAETRNRRTVWHVNPKSFPGAHFSVWPPDLVEPMIRAGCPEGGTVLDPFSGSGTTGMVAMQLGRSYIGIDLQADYLAMAEERITSGIGPPRTPS